MKRLKGLQDYVEKIDHLKDSYEEMEMLIEMSEEEQDESVTEEIQEELEAFKASLEEFRIQTLLSGKYDSSNAIVTLHAGALQEALP